MSRRNMILFIMLIVFAAIAVWIADPFNTGRTRDSERLIFEGIDIKNADRIEINSKRNSVAITKTDDQSWILPEKEDYPADMDSVKRILENLTEIPIGRAVTSNLKDLEKYGLDKDSKTSIRVYNNDRMILGMDIGKNGPDLLSSFIRVEDDDHIRLVPGNIKYFYEKPVSDWKDRIVLDLREYELSSLEIISDDYSAKILIDESLGYTSVEPVAEKELNREAVSKIISSLKPLRADGFLEDEENYEEIVLSEKEPLYTLNVFTSDNEKFSLYIIGSNEQKSRFFVTNQEKFYKKVIFSAKFESIFPVYEDLFIDIDPAEQSDAEQEG